MAKPRVLLIKTGGTVGQKPNKEGILELSAEEYLHLVRGLEDLADITPISLGNIDSTDMETNVRFTKSTEAERTKDRGDIARVINDNAFEFDGFVIIHGTDTMAESAAALTYMLPGLTKPIVLTGSQRSIWVPRSDAQNNIYTAVQAATKDFGEVVIAFGNYIIRGSRARKVNEEGYDAFMSPGVEPLGTLTALSEGIRLKDHRTRRGDFDPRIFTDFDTKIFHYKHVSGATVDDVLLSVVGYENVHGLLMSGFGAGNITSRLLPVIRLSRKLGKPVFVYTSCDTGAADMGIYSVGAAPLEAGAKPAGDMTLEALGQKLMYAIGRTSAQGLADEAKLKFVESIIRTPYNGDIMVTEKRR
ncbi:MAG TPA: asparaginase [Candidatus Nanoarchaeia archaeon]|nr:asparaginase [Candidatus Nanoarchaeia archaeon]